jgi:hypothetical protein
VFDVKMENSQRKAGFVVGGHMTDPPAAATYASVVSRESVRIALTVAALNDLEILAGDVQNAYCMHQYLRENEGRTALIVRALYVLSLREQHFGTTWRRACTI